MNNFTPLSASIGGALIGLSATLLMLFTGRIAGIGGILGGSLGLDHADKGWRMAFLAGLVLAPLTGALAGYSVSEPDLPSNWIVIIAAGLLVGFGVRMAAAARLAMASAESRGCRAGRSWRP